MEPGSNTLTGLYPDPRLRNQLQGYGLEERWVWGALWEAEQNMMDRRKKRQGRGLEWFCTDVVAGETESRRAGNSPAPSPNKT